MHLKSHPKVTETDLLTAIESLANNLARWSALVFFGENPNGRTRPGAVSQMVGWNPQVVERELDELTRLGVLIAQLDGSGRSYALVEEPSVRAAVIHFARRAAFD